MSFCHGEQTGRVAADGLFVGAGHVNAPLEGGLDKGVAGPGLGKGFQYDIRSSVQQGTGIRDQKRGESVGGNARNVPGPGGIAHQDADDLEPGIGQ